MWENLASVYSWLYSSSKRCYYWLNPVTVNEMLLQWLEGAIWKIGSQPWWPSMYLFFSFFFFFFVCTTLREEPFRSLSTTVCGVSLGLRCAQPLSANQMDSVSMATDLSLWQWANEDVKEDPIWLKALEKKSLDCFSKLLHSFFSFFPSIFSSFPCNY